MDRYQKVEKPKAESPINENEIRITSQGLVRNYISYATSLLQERRGKDIVLKAMGQAISKTVAIAEIIKRRVPRLHQDTAISSESITDVWEPIEEGLLPVEQTRHVSMISITLSTRELNKDSPGYQAPSTDQGRSQYNYPPQQQPPRQTRAVYDAGNEDSYVRGRGRGRGRGQGWNRGGYSNYQEMGGYSNTGRGGRIGGYGGRSGGYGGRDGGYGGRDGGYGSRDGGYGGRDGGYGGRDGGYGGRDGGYGGRGGGGYGGRGGGGYGGRGGGGYAGQGDGGYASQGGGGYGGQNGDYGGGQNGGYGGGQNGDGYGYRGTGYGRGGGRGGSGRGYGGRGRGRMGSRPRGGGDQA